MSDMLLGLSVPKPLPDPSHPEEMTRYLDQLTRFLDEIIVKSKKYESLEDKTGDVLVSTVTVANTTVETTLLTIPMAANSLLAGNLFKVHADGIVSNGGAAAADQITLRIRVNGVEMVVLTPVTRDMPVGSHWHIEANATQRTIGPTGSRAMHLMLNIDSVEEYHIAVGTIDTTDVMDITITAQWASAAADNTISIYQGYITHKN